MIHKQYTLYSGDPQKGTVCHKIEFFQRIVLYILVFGTALLIWNGNLTGIEIKCFFVQIGVIAISIFIPMQFIHKGEIRVTRNPIPWLAGIYVTCLVISYIRTSGTSLNYHSFVPQFFGVSIFFLIVLKPGELRIKKIISVLLAGFAVAVIYGLLQFINIDFISWDIDLSRGGVVSFFGNKNFFGIYLLLITPLAIYGYAIYTNKITRLICLFLGIGSVLVIVLSYSRGALVSFFIAALIIVLLQFYFNKSSNKTPLLRRLIPILIVFTILILTICFMPAQIKSDFQNIINNREYLHRIACYKAAMKIIVEKPFWGIGIGNFTIASRAIPNPALFFGDPNNLLTHVHNDFLEIWVEQGLIALVSYLSIIIIVFVNCLKIARTGMRRNRYVCAAIAFSILGFSLYSMVTIAIGNMACAFYFWVIMGLGYLASKESREATIPFFIIKLPNLKKFHLYNVIICATIGAFIVYSIAKKYIADIAVKDGYEFTNSGKKNEALLALDRAIAFDSKSIDALYQRGFISFTQGQYSTAITDFLHVNYLAPGYLNNYFNLASCFYRQRDFENAIRYADLSYRSFPSYEPAAVLLAYLHFYNGSLNNAQNLVHEALKKFPDNSKLTALNSKIKTALLYKKE